MNVSVSTMNKWIRQLKDGSSKQEQGKNKEKEWIIHEKLEKKDSTYRINFS